MSEDSDTDSAIQQARNALSENLETMATGSYLREEEQAHWDPPYSVKAVGKFMAEVEALISTVLHSPDPMISMNQCVEKLIAISDSNGGLLLDTEELDDLLTLMDALSSRRGLDHGEVRAQVIELVEN